MKKDTLFVKPFSQENSVKLSKDFFEFVTILIVNSTEEIDAILGEGHITVIEFFQNDLTAIWL
jgi:hypothetical protein